MDHVQRDRSDPDEDFRAVIRALTALRAVGGQGIRREEGIPGLIAVNEEGGIFTDRAMERGISSVAARLRQRHRASRATHSTIEFTSAVRAAFGPALAELDLDDDLASNAERLKLAVTSGLEQRLAWSGQLQFVVGCTLLSRPLRESLCLGPITFEPAREWLDRQLADGAVSETSYGRLLRRMDGRPVRRRKPSADTASEGDIADMIAAHPLICTITTQGLAPEAAEARGLAAARMAITAVALLWQTPSQALRGMHLSCDPGPRIRKVLVSRGHHGLLASHKWVGLPRGTYIEIDVWERTLREAADYLSLIAQLVDSWVCVGAVEGASSLRQSLAQALHFFGQACREEDHLMAVVKFTAALEALAGRQERILQLLERRVGLKRTHVLVRGRTTAEIMDEVYKEARSLTLHGKNRDIAYDWLETRQIAEWLARQAFLHCVEWCLEHPEAEAKEDLLSVA